MSRLMGAFTAPIEHGCLFLRDTRSKSGHASWNPAGQAYDLEDDSVIFSVIPSVDGMVTVRVWSGGPGSGEANEPYFVGALLTSHGTAVLHDANDHVSMTFRLARGANAFTVLTDSVDFPEIVDIVFPALP